MKRTGKRAGKRTRGPAPPRENAPQAPGGTVGRRETLLVLGVCLATAVLFTWPLVTRLAAEIPSGSRPPTVALFGLYTMEWTAESLGHGRPYWDAPFFHPHAGAFAWSEAQPLTSLVVWLVSRLTGMVPAYNLVLLGMLASTGLAGYVLARRLTDDRVAATWTALWATAGAYPISQLTILHLLAGAFPIACLALLLALARRPTLRVASAAGLFYFLTLTTCAQFGLFLTMLLPVAVVPLLWRKRWRWRTALRVAAPVLAGALAALPFLLAQRARLEGMGFERALSHVRGAYAPADLLIPARGHWLATHLFHLSDVPGVYPSDMGMSALLCLIAACALGALRTRGIESVRLRQRASVLAVAVTALLLGFGPRLGAVYVGLRSIVPGLDAVRTPARFGMFATVGVAALAAVALAFLRERTAARGPRRALTVVAFALLAAEMWAIPVGLVDTGRGLEDHRAVLSWLRDRAGGEAVAELPMAAHDGEAALEREVRAMRRGLVHGSPVVNGYSGYFPEPFKQLKEAVQVDLAGRARRYLQALGVRYVLLHDHDLAAAERGAAIGALGGRVVFEDGHDSLVLLEGAVPAAIRPTATSRRFRTPPAKGTVLAVPLEPAPHARLVMPAPGQVLELSWPGAAAPAILRLRGSVLVDAGLPWIHLYVQRAPRAGRAGEAILLPAERVPR